MGEKRNADKSLVGRKELKRTRHERPRHGNIKICGHNGVDWANCAQDRGKWHALVKDVMYSYLQAEDFALLGYYSA
jgi:hypothetical protein